MILDGTDGAGEAVRVGSRVAVAVLSTGTVMDVCAGDGTGVGGCSGGSWEVGMSGNMIWYRATISSSVPTTKDVKRVYLEMVGILTADTSRPPPSSPIRKNTAPITRSTAFSFCHMEYLLLESVGV
jgi:hypothetical protein